MRTLRRNQASFFYALFQEKKPLEDESGYLTGEYEVVYGLPIEARGNISAARGEARANPFGESLDYDRVLIPADQDIPIDEYAILWVERDPRVDEEGQPTQQHDYIVRKVARSLNGVQFAIKQVTVNV